MIWTIFLTRKELYRRFGKAWKRGYLLYGPPGTGKSSLIAAMANHLNYNIYDLDQCCLVCPTDPYLSLRMSIALLSCKTEQMEMIQL
ncbi:hypothetical protein CIPAW_11G161200 [Carya illinoinensis]|uniref:ATPase AAA-type core domain-containing protein n=1 Tax=Carya illinoinensis TaxID=32201 RepID=A0A8T1P5U6_CARIL|nr:hypothetical protein CIPAW_11G161200 [Carya illinoinensis]